MRELRGALDPRRDHSRIEHGLHWLGAAFATLSLGAIVYGLIESAWAALIGGVVLFAAFLLVEKRSRHPMLPLSLFRSKDFSGANLLTLFLYTALSGMFFFLPVNLIQVQGYSRTAGLLAIAALSLVMLHDFNRSLDRQSAGLNLPASERVKLGAAEAPASADRETRLAVKHAVAAALVDGFRRVMLIASALALLSSLVAGLFISGRQRRQVFDTDIL